MGKARSYEIVEYRKKIMNAICKSPELVKLLGEESSEYPEETIPYNKVFPYEFIPETIQETDRYINFELQTYYDEFNDVLRNVTVYFFIFCHHEAIRYVEDGSTYLWYDRIACELDNIFTDNDVIGIGKTKIISNIPYYPVNRFKGRQLQFKIKDFNDGRKYGK